jgi:hypothetical protein
MQTVHKYPNGYHVRQLDERVTPTALSDFFDDTGPTGEAAIEWLDSHAERIDDAYEASAHEPIASIQEMFDRLAQVDEGCDRLTSQRLVRNYLDQKRAAEPEASPIGAPSYMSLHCMPTLARPDIQRLDRHDQMRVLQHEVWTEAERLWLIEQLLDARGYAAEQPDESTDAAFSDALATLDGMTMEGLAGWSEPLRRLQLQFSVAKGAQDRIAVISTHRDTVGITENIGQMSIDELVTLRDQMVRRIETEIAIYQAGDGVGSPTDRLYEQIRWMESFLNFQYDIEDSGQAVEDMLRDAYDSSAVRYIATSIRGLQDPTHTAPMSILSQNLDSVVRRSARTSRPDIMSRGRQLSYADIETYLAALWQIGERASQRETVAHATRALGHTATQHV